MTSYLAAIVKFELQIMKLPKENVDQNKTRKDKTCAKTFSLVDWLEPLTRFAELEEVRSWKKTKKQMCDVESSLFGKNDQSSLLKMWWKI